MRRLTFELCKTIEEVEKFRKAFLKHKKFSITEANSKDGSYNYVIWYYE